MIFFSFLGLLLQTHIGMVLVAVNPYELYPIYGKDHIDKYSQQTDITLLPPHIFSTAQYAFTSMKRRLQNQSIIIRYNVKSSWIQLMIVSDLRKTVFTGLLLINNLHLLGFVLVHFGLAEKLAPFCHPTGSRAKINRSRSHAFSRATRQAQVSSFADVCVLGNWCRIIDYSVLTNSIENCSMSIRLLHAITLTECNSVVRCGLLDQLFLF